VARRTQSLYVRHGRDPIPVTVRVQWTDGTEGEVNAWTSQWTRTHVCVVRESAPPYHPFWVRGLRRAAAIRCTPGVNVRSWLLSVK
jgi:hypothetical protein